ncbi:MAG TPA: hypothetical protein VF752_13280 [Thermoleophilaceae bacterium]
MTSATPPPTALLTHEPTLASVWQAVAGRTVDDELLEWPPDVFALTNVLLARSEAYRFALSPPEELSWPPARIPGWADAVVDAARQWSAWVEDPIGALPELLAEEWEILREAASMPLGDLTLARDWRCCEALLTVHAIADEACAGLAVALDSSNGEGFLYRARGRELLARTGSLTRIPSDFVRVLPKVLTPAHGTSLRSLSRYASVHGPGVETQWHKVRGRRPGAAPYDKGVNYLLLPWPLRVRESDFRPLEGSVHSVAKEPFGFFEFAPSEGLDLDLVDRTLVAAQDEVGLVNVVVLPESALDQSEIDPLEELLDRHGVIGLIAGVRHRADCPGRFPANWVHLGISTGEHWTHICQGKHHRWSLDEDQIYQYHLGGALHPHVRWWEAMEVPRRSVRFVEAGGATLVALVCEDLAQIDDVADVLRSVGPTLVVTPLLDGPQLSSRWTARYASVLADDPGSAVLTLTSFGMARRSRPRGRPSSSVVALWKDPGRGTREIALEDGAHGILISTSTDRAARRSVDGRRPVDNASEVFDMSVYQVRAATAGSPPASSPAPSRSRAVLETEDLTILTSWAEAVAEAMACAPDRIDALPPDAGVGGQWRAELGIAEPSRRLDEAIGYMAGLLRETDTTEAPLPLDALLRALIDHQPGENRLETLVRRVLRSALEQRQARRRHEGDRNMGP